MEAIDRVLPYGFMAAKFLPALKYGPPSAWADGATYDSWLSSELARLAADAWPEWAGAKGWVGAARGLGLALTLADLDLMSALCAAHFRGISRHAGGKSHEDWFEREDGLFHELWWRYHTAFKGSGITCDEFEAGYIEGADEVLTGRTPFWLKAKLQRPRANQMAYFLDTPPPALQFASSAWSPSAISGHSFQGFMAAVHLYMKFGPVAGARLTPAGERELALLATDTGDRRVYAGVHYPSDNAMSWRVALSFLERIGAPAAVRKFASDAVRNSVVYAAMKASPGHGRCIAMVDELLT